MDTLEDAYEQIMINESLSNQLLNEKLVEITKIDDIIEKTLKRHYKIYYERMKELDPNNRDIKRPERYENDDVIMKTIIGVLLDVQSKYEGIFKRFIMTRNEGHLKKGLAGLDKGWTNYIKNTELSWFWRMQPLNLAFIDVLRKMGLKNFRVDLNEAGWPVYYKHLIHLFVAMDVVDDMIRSKQLSEDYKDVIGDYLFNIPEKAKIQREIDAWFGISNSKKPVSREPNPEPLPQPEPQLGDELPVKQPTSKEDRLALIRSLVGGLK